MFLLAIRYFLVLAAMLAGLTLLGRICLRLVRCPFDAPYIRGFSELAVGTTVFITAYSILKTGGVTVHLGFIVLLPFVLSTIRSDRSSQASRPRMVGVYGEMALAATALYAHQIVMIYNGGGDTPLFPPSKDLVIFTDLANFLNATGREHSQIDYIFWSALGVAPYHYFEIWLTAAIAGLFDVLTLLSEHLVSAPLAGAIVYIGFCAVCEQLGTVTRVIKLLCFAVVVLTAGLYLPIFDAFPVLARAPDYFLVTPVLYLKLFPIYLFVIAAALAVLRRAYVCAALCLSGLAIASTIAAPSAFGALVVLAISGAWTHVLRRREILTIGLSGASVALFLAVFYTVFKGDIALTEPSSLQDTMRTVANLRSLRTAVNIVVGSLLQVGSMMIPLLVAIAAGRGMFRRAIRARPDIGIVAAGLGAIILCGLAVWAALHFVFLSDQFFTRPAQVALNVLAILVIGLIAARFQELTASARAALLVLLIGAITIKTWNHGRMLWEQRQLIAKSSFSTAFIEDVARKTPALNPLGVHLLAASDYAASTDKFVNNRAGAFTGLISSALYPISLSVFSIPISDDPLFRRADETSVRGYTFYKFVRRQREEGTFTSVVDSQLDFIDRYDVDYMIVSRAVVLDARLADRVLESIEDPLSGERFLLIRHR